MAWHTNRRSTEIWIAILYTAGIFILTVILFDIIGVVAMFISSLLWFSSKSMMFLAYPIWIVTSIFNAAIYASFSNDKFKLNNALVNNNWIIAVVATFLSVIALLLFDYFNQLQTDWRDNFWVPGHKGLTITYFITLIMTTIFFIKTGTLKKQYGT